MKATRYIPFLIIALMVSTSSGRSESKDDAEKWVLVNKGNGIVSYGRLSSKKSSKEVYAIGIVKAPLPVIEALLRDVRSHKDYVHMVSEAYKVPLPGGRPNGKDEFYEYCRLGMPWPVKDRDAVGNCRFRIDKKTGILYVVINGMKTSLRPKKGTVRMPVTDLLFRIKPVDDKSCEVMYKIKADPAISLPSWVLNMLFKTLGYKTIENMRDMVKKPKYRSAATLVTTTPYGTK